jgi:cell wall-associated NlpC family hydrolase
VTYKIIALILMISCLMLQSCASNPRFTAQEKKPGLTAKPQHTIERPATSSGVIIAAEKCLGIPYRFGGMDRSGMDCSGLVCYSFKRALGKKLPRTSAQQYQNGFPLKRSELRAGDLVFFATSGGKVNHVGIYGGSGKFIHSASSTGVGWASLDSSYWKKSYVGARRYR